MSATSIVPFPSVLHLQQLIEAQQCTSYYDARSTPSEKKIPSSTRGENENNGLAVSAMHGPISSSFRGLS